jgi:hypothetical protein
MAGHAQEQRPWERQWRREEERKRQQTWERDNGGEREEEENKREDDMWVSHVSYLIPHSIVLKPNKELGRTYSYQPNIGWLQPNPKN